MQRRPRARLPRTQTLERLEVRQVLAADVGAAIFGLPTTVDEVPPSQVMVPADVDGDGRTDLVGGSLEGTVGWWSNSDAGATWHYEEVMSGLAEIVDVLAADLDGDADVDLLILGDNGLSGWFENLGDAAEWQLHDWIETASAATSAAVGDVDEDGDPDLVITNENGLSWWENGPDTNWTEHLIDDTVNSLSWLLAEDMDRDGDLDLVTGGPNDFFVTWFEQSEGDWTKHSIDTGVHSEFRIQVADFDQDDDVDVFVDTVGVETFWLENDGTSQRWTARRLVLPGGSTAIAVGDFDSDGDVDVVTHDPGGRLAWWPNIGPEVQLNRSLEKTYNEAPPATYSLNELQRAIDNVEQHDWAAQLFEQAMLDSAGFYTSRTTKELRSFISRETPLLSVADPETGASPWGNWYLEADGAWLRSASSGERYQFDATDTSEDWNVHAVHRSLRLFYITHGVLNSDPSTAELPVSRLELAAMAAVLTDDPSLARGPATLIERFAEVFSRYRLNKVNQNVWLENNDDYFGKIDGWKKHDGDILTSFLAAYGLLRNTSAFTDEQRFKIDADLVQYVLDYYEDAYAQSGYLGASNLQDQGSSWQAIGIAAAILKDEPRLEDLFQAFTELLDPSHGFITTDGTLTAAPTPDYHQQFVLGFGNLPELLKTTGAGDLFSDERTPLWRDANAWTMRIESPLGTLPAMNDSHVGGRTALPLLERAAVQWDDAAANSALQQVWGPALDGGGIYSLFHRPTSELAGGSTRRTLQSEHLPGLGLMVLRDDVHGARQTMVTLDYGGSQSMVHRHHDYLNLGLWSQGREMISEMGYVTSPEWARRWQSSPLAHNTVREAARQVGPGESRLWHQTKGVSVAEAGSADNNSRSVVLLSPGSDSPLVVDIFRASQGGRSHTWVMHGATDDLQVHTEKPFESASVPSPLRDGSRVTLDGTIHATWQFEEGSALDLFMMGFPHSELTIATAPAEEPAYAGMPHDVEPADLPGRGIIQVERDGLVATFAAVLAPRSMAAAVPIVRSLKLETSTPETVALELLDGNTRWLVLHTGASNGHVTAADGLELSGRSAVIEITDGKVVSLVLSGGKSLAYDGRVVTSGSGTGNASWHRVVPANELFAEHVTANNPLAYWRLSEGSGSKAKDSSVNHHDGTLVGDVELAQSPAIAHDVDQSIRLQGLGDVVVPDDPRLRPASLTVSAWVRPDVDIQDWSTAMAKTTNWRDGYGLYHYDGKIWFYAEAGRLTRVSADLTLDEWSHVVGVYDTDTISLYLNGKLVAQRPYNGSPMVHSFRDLHVGSTKGSYHWRGNLDEVALFDSALSAADVSSLYDSALSKPPTPGITGRVFHDSDGDQIFDQSETAFGDWTVYLDRDRDGERDEDEPVSKTAADGTFHFLVKPDDHQVRVEPEVGWLFTAGPQQRAFVMQSQVVADRLFGLYQPTTMDGWVHVDENGNGRIDSPESPTADVRVYVDENRNQRLDPDEVTSTTDNHGRFVLNVRPGTHEIRVAASDSPWLVTAPATGSITATVLSGESISVDSFAVLPAEGYASHVTAENPNAYWRLGGAATMALDLTGNGHAGRFEGEVERDAATVIIGEENLTASFNGRDSRIIVPDASSLRTEAFTLSMWLRADSGIKDWATALAKTTNWLDGYGVYYSQGKVWFYAGGNVDGRKLSAALNTNRWTHVVASYDGSTLRLYSNGELAAEETVSGPLSHSANEMVIGATGNAYHWQGEIDQVAIHPTRLTDRQVREIFQARYPATRQTLNYCPAGYWPLDESSGNTTWDLTENEQHGDLAYAPERLTQSELSGVSPRTLHFDGERDDVSVASQEPFSMLTVAAWIRPDDGVKDWATVLAQTSNWRDGYGLFYYRGQIWFYAQDDDIQRVSAAVNVDEWTHVAGVYDGTSLRIYLNGQLAATADHSGRVSHSSQHLRIGSTNGRYFWKGAIREASVFDRALTEAEIDSIYSAATE